MGAQASGSDGSSTASKRFRPGGRQWFSLASAFLVINGWGVWTLTRPGSGPKPLEVTGCAPQGTTAPQTLVTVDFDRPMTAPEAVGGPAAEDLLVCDPEIPGERVWDNDRRLVLRPADPLKPATRYTVSTSNGVRALDGSRLRKPLSFSFETDPLKLESLTQNERTREGEIRLNFNFNVPVAVAALKTHLKSPTDRGRRSLTSLSTMGPPPPTITVRKARGPETGRMWFGADRGSGILPMVEA